MLVGRTDEEKQLDALIERGRKGESGVLVLRGEAGIGKTALLDYAIRHADGFYVLRALGVESEAEIAFAGLQQLLHPVAHAFAEIPRHQARALATALGIEDGPVPERLVVSAATLSVLASAAEDRPVLCVVDDAHWLDHASADTLTFVARRLHAEGIAMLFAVRDPERAVFFAPGIAELRLAGLAPVAARTLLDRRAPGLSALTAEGIVALTNGNPLALLEVPRALTEAQRAGRAPLGEPLPVGAEIERAYGERVRALSEQARNALLLVAAGDPGDPDGLSQALTNASIGRPALAESEDAGLLMPERLEFCHPLARSAVYQLATPGNRRAAHTALAAATRASDRQAWQLSAAVEGPDESVASALEAAAATARSRGGVAAEAKALERAAHLTADDEVRARRLLKAALAAEAAGWFERAEGYLNDAAELTRDPELRVQVVARRSYLLADRGELDRAFALAIDAAEHAAPRDAALVLALGALMALTHSLDIDAAAATADRAWRLAGSAAHADLNVCENVARTLILTGRVGEAAALVRSSAGRADAGTVIAVNFGTDFLYLEDYSRAAEMLERSVEVARATEALGVLSYALDQLSKLETRLANLTRAYALELESLQLTEPLGNDVALAASLAWLAQVEAILGRAEARSHGELALKIGERMNDAYNVVRARGALGLDALARGDATDALVWLQPAVAKTRDGRVGHPNFFRLDADLIEALVRVGRTAEAEAELAKLEKQAGSTGSVWAHAAAARCRALLTRDPDVQPAFELALESQEREPSVFERARTELCYGERLRRAGQRKLAREQLRSAVATFDDLGARPWAERARNDLRATGEHVHRRDPTAAERLTPQEFQIALLVAEGLTNRDVGARLFLSPKTIEFHLSRVFRKLDVRSRGELIRLFASQVPDSLPL